MSTFLLDLFTGEREILSAEMQVLVTVPGSRRRDEAHSGFSFLVQFRVFKLAPPPHPPPGFLVMSPL